MRGMGSEQHLVDSQSDKYYRLVRADKQVLVRWGRRGTSGQVQVRTFASTAEAQEFFYHQFDAKDRKGYVLATRDVFLLDEAFDGDVRSAEATFIEHWLTALDNSFEGDGLGEWVVVDGLLAVATKSPLLASLHSRLLAQAHVTDSVTDRILARVPNGRHLAMLFEVTRGFVPMIVIGDVRGDETQDEMRRVLSLYYPTHPSPESLFSTARKLAGVER